MTLEDLIRENVDQFIEKLEELKTQDITVLDLTGLTPMCDCFIIATVIASPQAKAAISALLRTAKDMKIRTRKVEGDFTSRWVLLDFGDIIIHLMEKEERTYYDLEEIWRRVEQ
ncbi:MAG: ribosome silencing factor [Caldisericia bacterium]|nr:ribosome silencing factor [Caldisericia bacterium]